ncbi:TetR/AcrR family transcriptional regulator [Kitasatospora sp. NBC_01287]|uniref:TetR/AcrR family transcriptional regulator n=1 Tax=Kitasatospora sp. NBC_01287 TaxID=2903573 RepID=UPI00224F1FA7|nr:TetR/AcrR family transcriptional regulator [Kitasatospora sp. NBC_01287]MCX4745936.1 TetR/AcrR family transcriptional regulator [Kitasatospora sp. NBC_01287]
MSERVTPAPERKRRRPTKQGTVLSEQVIVDTALRLVGLHGAQALTVRRLGAALGADPSAIYRYFRGIDDLLLAIADELIGRAQHGWRSTGDWRTDLRDIGQRIHAAYQAHPQAAMLAAHRTTGRDNETRAVEAILGLLRSAGFPDPEAVRIYHAVVDQSLAFAALDAAALALPAAAQAADLDVWQYRYAHLDPGTHPNIAATAALLAADMQLSGYPFALELLLDAIAARLPSDHR